ncbi:DUF6538 domain-containing protein [Terasakiella pusilla]|uniref:DUF6538 domain-containing protein n=1 Tax=Terasakiella pusilla TaxID=64973 RepID=UPI003AA87319
MTRVSYYPLHRPKNSSNWYFRAKVPAELRELYGKREEKISLDWTRPLKLESTFCYTEIYRRNK